VAGDPYIDQDRRVDRAALPAELLPALEAYLAIWRPRLARPDQLARSPALWPTQGGGTRISDIHLYNIVVARTRAAFGQPVNPHLFRDAAATTIALDSPEQVRLAGALLGHRSFATTERYYNLARAAEAATA
jgi:integrase/recombinase XerD